jgi:broad specificity phosphatase PhoE
MRSTITVVFETHSISEDNERGIASGWNDCRLSARGRGLAVELGDRRRDDDLDAVFSSDLRRARETAELAFADQGTPRFLDWRLRECNYGNRNGEPSDLHARERSLHVDDPYPGGESWRQAVDRTKGLLDDLAVLRPGQRVLLIGHVATRWALDHHLNGIALETLVTESFDWQQGWEYRLPPAMGPERPARPDAG